ncbi:MAG: TatD family hydrolase [Parcubacteria group bacterium]|nr:TatD family hydrolase [Parcubacteria group bacterium]
MPKFFDAHTHLNFSDFDKDRDEIIKKTLLKDIWMVNVGSDKISSAGAVSIAQKYEAGVYAAVGIHPDSGEDYVQDFYKKLSQNPKVVAIGECGLDYAFFVRKRRERQQKRASAEAESEGGFSDADITIKKERQKELFIRQIKLAEEVGKPLMIHCREAFADLIKILDSFFIIHHLGNPGILHFFSGSLEDAKRLLEMGFSFSFGGVITFTRDYDEVIKFIPMDKILLETDAPFISPEPLRGKRNEPVNVELVAQKIAEIKNLDLTEAAKQTTENARKIFGI